MASRADIIKRPLPPKSPLLDARVSVKFHDDDRLFYDCGYIVRSDLGEPMLTIIKLDNGQYVLGSELRSWNTL